MAEQILKTMDPKPDFGVIVFDGFVHMNGEKIDAIIARAFDKTQDEGYIQLQSLLRRKNLFGRFGSLLEILYWRDTGFSFC